MKAPAISSNASTKAPARTKPTRPWSTAWPRACAAPTWAWTSGRDIAPSTELCKWFGHVDERWDEFRQRYNAELAAPEQQARMSALQAAGKRPLTLLCYGARNTEHNQAVALREALLAHARGRRARGLIPAPPAPLFGRTRACLRAQSFTSLT